MLQAHPCTYWRHYHSRFVDMVTEFVYPSSRRHCILILWGGGSRGFIWQTCVHFGTPLLKSAGKKEPDVWLWHLVKTTLDLPLFLSVPLRFIKWNNMPKSSFSKWYFAIQMLVLVCYVVALVSGKRFGPIDVSACLCMSIGLIFFTLADSTMSPSFNMYGEYGTQV